MTETSAALARLVTDPSVPDAVLDRAADLLAAVASRTSSGAVPASLSLALDHAGQDRVAPLGSSERRSVYDAAAMTGMAAAQGLGTSRARSVVAVAAAVSAVAEDRDLEGRASLAAFAVGSEIALRVVGELERSGYPGRGWDTAGAGGSIGSAAAVAALVQVTDATARQALAVGATQGAGLALAGPPLDAWLVGKAATNGLEAALLCAAGLSGPPDGIEGRRGLFTVAAPDAEPARLLDGLGQQWSVLEASELDDAPEATTLAAIAGRLRTPGSRFTELSAASRA